MFYGMMWGIIALNLACLFVAGSGAFIGGQEFFMNTTNLSDYFSLSLFGALGAGGAVIGLLGLITRQYVYATGAILVWVVGLLLPIVQWVVAGFPLMLGAMLPAELSWVSAIPSAGVTIVFFFGFLEVLTNRSVSTSQ